MRGCKSFGFMTKGDANEKDDSQMLTSNAEISSDISTKNRIKNKTIITNTSIIRYISEKFRKHCFKCQKFNLIIWLIWKYDVLCIFRGKVLYRIPRIGLPVVYVRETLEGKVIEIPSNGM